MQNKCYAFKTRVKTWDKLVQKVEIKREENLEYNLASITDVLGLRIVTLFRQDMSLVVETILSLISHELSYNPMPFVKNSLKEAIIYTPSIGNDPVISQVIQKIESFKLIEKENIEEKASAARYSSIHLVAFIDEKVPDHDDSYRIPIEIQIRTVFEDAWGEIDHKYGYQNRTGKSDTTIQNPVLVKKNLLTLKKFVDSCAEYADNIRDLAVPATPKRQVIRALALDTNILVEKNLVDVDVPHNIIEQYIKIRQQRAEAENGNGSKQTFINAAEEFKQLYSQIKESKLIESAKGKKLFRYYIKMDEALCRLSVNNFQEITNSISIYNDLKKEYVTHPIIHIRLGQAYLEIGRFEDARGQLKKCLLKINRLAAFPETKRLVALPDIELKRIGVGIYILLGLAYWKEADELYAINKGSYKIKQYLEQAYIKTERGLKVPNLSDEHKTKLVNNLLFYALEIVYFKETNGDNNKFKEAIIKHLEELKPRLEILKCKNINQLDTLMSGYTYINDIEKATSIAYRIEKLVVEQGLVGNLVDMKVLNRVNSLLNRTE